MADGTEGETLEASREKFAKQLKSLCVRFATMGYGEQQFTLYAMTRNVEMRTTRDPEFVLTLDTVARLTAERDALRETLEHIVSAPCSTPPCPCCQMDGQIARRALSDTP